MPENMPFFRIVMGTRNALFDEARQNDVALKHVPVDFQARHRAGETDALRAEIARLFRARYQEHDRELTQAWVTRYLNDAARFCGTPELRFVTYKAGDIWWAETAQPAVTWRHAQEGGPDDPVPVELVARPLDRPWSRTTLGGRELSAIVHVRPGQSLRHNRSEIGQANDELSGYLNALVADRDVSAWHALPEWVADAMAAQRQTPRSGAVRRPADLLHDFLEEQQLSYEVVRRGDLEGFVYAIRCAELPNWIKIGHTTHPDVETRLRELQIGNPHRLHVLHARRATVAAFAERFAHDYLRDTPRGMGEWFWITPPKAKDAIAYGVGADANAVAALS